MKVEHFLTEDGSSSLRVPELDETYHSSHGAIQESNHVFIDAGLKAALKHQKMLKIFEVGFGSGLNAFLTLNSIEPDEIIHYATIDLNPLGEESYSKLNFASLINRPNNEFLTLHEVPWGVPCEITENFLLNKNQGSFTDYQVDETFNLIYFDAFGPDKQPELWASDVLKKCFDMLESGGIFVTYSAKGQVKRDLRDLGFTVESLPGPPGKFQMTRAIKPNL